jgi:hypothetical protein
MISAIEGTLAIKKWGEIMYNVYSFCNLPIRGKYFNGAFFLVRKQNSTLYFPELFKKLLPFSYLHPSISFI